MKANEEGEELRMQVCSNGVMPSVRRLTDVLLLPAGAEAEDYRHRDGGTDAQHSHATQRAAPGALHQLPADSEGVQSHQPGSMDQLPALC